MSTSPFEQRMKQMESQQPAPASPFEQRMRELDVMPPDPDYQYRKPEDPSLRGFVESQPVVGALPRLGSAIGEGAYDAVNAPDRQTRATRDLLELGSQIGLAEFLGDASALKKAGVSAALSVTTDPEEFVKILQSADPAIAVQYDEAGNVLISKGNRRAVVNKPGLSALDIAQGVGLASAYAPGATAATGGMRGMGQVMAQEGLAQAAIEASQSALGGEFNEGEVALAAGGAGAFQALFQGLAVTFPWLRESIRAQGVTPETRELFRKAAEDMGLAAQDITDDVIRQYGAEAQRATNPAEAGAVLGEREFGIRLTEGERTRNQQQLRAEADMRTGGGRAEEIVTGFDRERARAVQEARGRVEEQIGGPPIRSQDEMGATVAEGVQGAERAMRDAVREAYAAVGDAQLSPEGFRGLLGAVSKAVRGAEFDRSLPETKKILGEVIRAQRLIRSQGTRPRPQDLARLDVLRKRLNTAIDSARSSSQGGRASPDERQLILMRQAFDGYLDDAVVRGLFSGDTEALSALKNARGLRRRYGQMFERDGKGDLGGQFMARVIEENPTAEQTAEMILGAGTVAPAGSRKVAAQIKEVLGADSEAFQSVRQEFLRRLFVTREVNGEQTLSAARTATNLRNVLERRRTLVDELFSPEEVSLLNRFVSHLERADPVIAKNKANPSGTGDAVSRQVMSVLGKTLAAIGATVRNPGFLVSSGVSELGDVVVAGRARAAVRPFSVATPIRPAPIAVGAGTMQAGQNESDQRPDQMR